MKSISLPLIFNTIIVFTATFFVVAVPFGFINISPLLRIVFNLAISSCIAVSAFGIFTISESKRKVKTKTSLRTKDAVTALNALNANQISTVIKRYFQKIGLPFQCKKGYYRVNGACLYFCLLPEELSANDVISIRRNNPYDCTKLIVVSQKFSSGALKYCDKKTIPFRTEYLATALLEVDLSNLDLKPEKRKKNITSMLFYKTNGKKLIVYGVCLFALSFFVFYPVYYFVFGGIFIVYGLIALFFGKIKPVIKNDDLPTILTAD